MHERTRRPLPTLASVALAGLALVAAAPGSFAAEPEVVYPGKVTTLQGRVFRFDNIGHSRGDGYFVIYDGETEGRVLWRDLDSINFAGNLKHRPGAEGPRQRGTERVELQYVDGTERVVNMIVGDIHGYDGLTERTIRPADITRIDFDQVKIAPKLYKVCERGHVWEEEQFRFCPYDGLPLDSWRVQR